MLVSAREAVPNLALVNLREERAWSQQDVADQMNAAGYRRGWKEKAPVTAHMVSRWERGTVRQPSRRNCQLLCDVFGVTLDQLGFARRRPDRQAPISNPPPLIAASSAGFAQLALAGDRSLVGERVEASQRSWLAVRQGLNQHRAELTEVAARRHRAERRVGTTALLTHDDWMLPAPVDLARVELAWSDGQVPVEVTGTERESRHARPLLSAEQRYRRYSQAIRDLDRPRLFENRLSYRLLDVAWAESGGRLTFGTTTYFDMVDVCEALAHELAATHLAATDNGLVVQQAPHGRMPFRQFVGDPFDLRRRPLLPSIDTLTIRRSATGARFVLHQRDPRRVAVAGGMYHIMPAGVFQPASIAPGVLAHDFDLWRNLLREYSEEFLGNLEHEGSASAPIDYDHEEPFRALNQARRGGQVRALCFGIGLDPLTLCGEILTAVVIDADVFDDVFGALVHTNEEGIVMGADKAAARRGAPFVEDCVEQLLESGVMAPAAAACLELAWRHRDQVLAG